MLDLGGPAAIRICQWRGRTPWRWGEIAVPPDAMDGSGVIRDPAAAAGRLRRLLNAIGARPRTVWVVLPPMAAVEQCVQVPRVWPWERALAAESLARRMFALNPESATLRAVWRSWQTVHMAAVLRDALAGTAAMLNQAGVRAAGVELASGPLARLVRDGVAVQAARHYILLVAARSGLPVCSAWAPAYGGQPLAEQILRLIRAAREEGGDVPGRGALLLIGHGTDDADPAGQLSGAGWAVHLVRTSGLPGDYLPWAPRRPRPLNLAAEPRDAGRLAAAALAAAGAAGLVGFQVWWQAVTVPALARAADEVAVLERRTAPDTRAADEYRKLLAQKAEWDKRLAGIHRTGREWKQIVAGVQGAAAAAGVQVDAVRVLKAADPGPAGKKGSGQAVKTDGLPRRLARITGVAPSIDALERFIESLSLRRPFGGVRLALGKAGPNGIEFTAEADLLGG